MSEGKDAADVIGSDLTEVMPGRPTIDEHQHPFDTIREPIDGETADFLTKMHILTIVAAEQQTMNLYMNLGNRPADMLGRGLYAEIAQIEEQHVSHYESLDDPTASWWEMAVLHEYSECFNYYSCLKSETDPRIKKMWQWHLDCEIDHLQRACEMLQQYGDKEVEELLPDEMPETLITFESNKEYIREILASQVKLTTNLESIVGPDKVPDSYKTFQKSVNSAGVPSREIIKQTGDGYRLEILGPHPVEQLRSSGDGGGATRARRPGAAAKKRPGKASGGARRTGAAGRKGSASGKGSQAGRKRTIH